MKDIWQRLILRCRTFVAKATAVCYSLSSNASDALLKRLADATEKAGIAGVVLGFFQDYFPEKTIFWGMLAFTVSMYLTWRINR